MFWFQKEEEKLTRNKSADVVPNSTHNTLPRPAQHLIACANQADMCKLLFLSAWATSSKTNSFFWFAFDRNNPRKNKPGEKTTEQRFSGKANPHAKIQLFLSTFKIGRKISGMFLPVAVFI